MRNRMHVGVLLGVETQQMSSIAMVTLRARAGVVSLAGEARMVLAALAEMFPGGVEFGKTKIAFAGDGPLLTSIAPAGVR